MTQRTKRIIVLVAIAVVITVIVLLALRWGRPLWHLFRNPERIRALIGRWGVWAPLALIGIQIVQVVIAPLPGNVVAITSGYIFGLGRGVPFCLIGVVLGASISFLLSRVLGRRILMLFIPEATMAKFDTFVVTKGPFYLFLLILFPNPIGDWLYYLAGLSAIPLPLFLLMVLVGRIPSNLFENFIGFQVYRLGSQGYHLALWQWALFLGVLLALAAAYYLNRKRIMDFFMRVTRFPTD